MAIAHSDIARVLDGARRRQGWIVLGAALGFGAAGVLAWLLLGAALLGAGWGSPPVLRQVTLALAAITALAALTWAALVVTRRASSPIAVARSLGERAPALRDDLLSAVELEEEYEEARRTGRYSVALMDAHARWTAERLGALDLRAAFPATPARRGAGAMAVVLAVAAAAALVAPRTLAAGWRRLTGAGGSPVVRRSEPITGDVQLTYVYPAYTRREPRTLSGTGGEISAPKGTEVRLETRADRVVAGAEIAIEPAAPGTPARGPRIYELSVRNGRGLSGRFVLEEGGTYRFRFTSRRRLVAEGPPLPITVEPDAYPEVRITAPEQEVEVDGRARVHVEWMASDDVGLGDLTLVTRPEQGEERRDRLRAFDGASRREAGSLELDLAPLRLAEGERLLYWLEVTDGDTVSGPKRAASATHAVKIYSEAEHHRAALAKAQRLWEEMVALLGDRLGLFDEPAAAGQEGGVRPPSGWTPQRVAQASVLDGRTRALHQGLRTVARELRRDRAAPRQLAPALENAAGGIAPLEASLTAARGTLSRLPGSRQPGLAALVGRVAELDRQLDRELEKDVLYLEQLFDQQRADDLVRTARDLAARRRDLADLMERYRQAPTDARRRELLAEVARMRARMQEVMRRMAELARGMGDEHMNREAVAELSRSRDAVANVDEVARKLAAGDVEGALKALDQLGNTMQELLSSLERTAGRPGERNAPLARELAAFRRQLDEVQGRQEELARETDQLRGEYRQRVAQRLRQLEGTVRRLEQLAAGARAELQQAERGLSARSEEDFAQARDRLEDLRKALHGRDLDASLETVRRTLGPLQRLAVGLQDDAFLAEHYPQLRMKDAHDLRDAQRHAQAALGPARQIRDELERMFPDPRTVLPERDQQRMGQLAQRQGQLEREANDLRQKLDQLSQQAPLFPPRAGELLGGAQRHMQRAQGELAQRNPQRGHGEQRDALDGLERFRKGMEDAARNAREGSGPAFPFPFGEDPEGREGEGLEAAREKVEIPGADRYKVPDEFRKDLLDAMKQGAPEPYRGDVQHYYEELVR